MDFALIGIAAIVLCVVGVIFTAIFFIRMVTYEPPKSGKRRKIE